MAKIIFEVCYASNATDIFHIAYQSFEPLTIRRAFEMLKISDIVPDLFAASYGVFSKPVSLDYLIQNGDRIEIYRPLKISPMEARRLRQKKTS